MTPDEIRMLPPDERREAVKAAMGSLKCKGVFELKTFDYYAWKRQRRKESRDRLRGRCGGSIL